MAADSCGSDFTYQALMGHFWSHTPCVGQQGLPYDPARPPPPSFADVEDEMAPAVTVPPSRVQNVCDASSASGCNVCSQCCKSYITAGHSCDRCAKEECLNAAAAPAPSVATRQADSRSTARLAKLKRFGRRKAVMLSVHVTHHAGTILCDRVREHVQAPEFACMSLRNLPPELASEQSLDSARHAVQWQHKHNVSFTSAEFRSGDARLKKGGNWDWSKVDWDRGDFASIVVFRDPIARLLNGDGTANRRYGSIPKLALRHPWVRDQEFYYDREHPPKPKMLRGKKIEPLLIRTPKLWQEYAKSSFTNSYALRVFCNKPCMGEGEVFCPPLTEADLEYAKSWLRKVTVLVDQSCLATNLRSMFADIGWKTGEIRDSRGMLRSNETALREIIANDTLYDQLVERNKYDIALYEWAKKMSYVQCPAS